MNVDSSNKDVLNVSLIIDENNTTHIKINPRTNYNVNSICGEVCTKYNLNQKVKDKLGKEIKKRIDGLMQSKDISDKTINRLYYESIERKKEKEAFLNEMRREKESVILNKFSFTPNINKNSNLLYDRKHVKIEDKLYNEFRVIKEKQNYERLISEISERNKTDKNNVNNASNKAKNSKIKIKGNSISTLKKINSLNDTETNKREANKNVNKIPENNQISNILATKSKEKILFDNEDLKNNKENKTGIKNNNLKDLSEKVANLSFEDLSLINKNRILNTDNSIEDSYINLKSFPNDNLELSKEPENKINKKKSENTYTQKNDLLVKTPAFFKNSIDSLFIDTTRLAPKKRNTYNANNPNNLLSQLSKKFSFNNPNNERNSYLMRFMTLNAKPALLSSNANRKKSMINLNNNINRNLNNFESFNFNREKTRGNTINNTVNQFKLNLNTSGSVNKVFDVISEEEQIIQGFNTMPDSNVKHDTEKEIEFEKTIKSNDKKKLVSNKHLKNLQENIFNINLNNNDIKNVSKQKDKDIIFNQEKTEMKKLYKGLESANNLKFKSNIFETAKKESLRTDNVLSSIRNQTAFSSKQIGNYFNIASNDKYSNDQLFMNPNVMSNEAKTALVESNVMTGEIKDKVKIYGYERVNIEGDYKTIRLKTENKSANNLSSRFFNTDHKTKSYINCDFINSNTSNFNCLNREEIKQHNDNYINSQALNKNENNNTNDSDLTIININNISDKSKSNSIKNNNSNDDPKVLSNYKAELNKEKVQIPVEKSKSNKNNQLLNNHFTKKNIKLSNPAAPAKSSEISKSKLKHLFKKERGHKDIFTHLYDRRNDTKIFRENYSKKIFSEIYPFKPTTLDSNSLEKNSINFNNMREENKEKFYKRLSDSKRLSHIFNKKQSNNFYYKIFSSAERNSKRIDHENNSTEEQMTFDTDRRHQKVKNEINKADSHNHNMNRNRNLFILDTYSSLSSRLTTDNKNPVALTDRNENNKPTILKKLLNRSKSKTVRNTPISQSMTCYETNLFNSGKKAQSNFLINVSKTNEKNIDMINEKINRKIIYTNKSENLGFNLYKGKFGSEFENFKYDLQLQKNANNSAADKETNEARIANISVNQIAERENNIDGNSHSKDERSLKNDENSNYLDTEIFKSKNSNNYKDFENNDFQDNREYQHRLTYNSYGNEGEDFENLEKLKISKDKNINSLNGGGSYYDLLKIKSYDSNYKKINNENDTFIVHKTISNCDSNQNKNGQSSPSERNNNKQNPSFYTKLKARFSKRINNENMKIREIKQEEYLNNIVDELNENRVKQGNVMFKKYNQSLKKIKMNQLNEIYEITIRSLDELNKLKESGISNFIIENLIYPFLNLVGNRGLSLNFNDFSTFANQTLDAFSNEVQ